MKLRPISSAVLLLLSALSTGAAVADDAVRHSYIVQLVDKPAASYTGQIAGLAATMPAQGERLNVDASAVQSYISYLDGKQSAVLNTLSNAEVTQQYSVVLNGFAAMLTDDEVRALKKNSAVASVQADSILQMDTSYTPSFLGLDAPGGLWEQLGGKAGAGENMILGIVDGGIWPENPSFADRVDENGVASHNGATRVYDAPPANWKGICQTGEGFGANNCNNKLIGARYFGSAAQALHWTEFRSPRDSVAGATGHGGHGSHTASTSGGNANVQVVTGGLPLGKVSGMAPRARIAAYKVCWTDAGTGLNGCATSNSVAAIEQAVKDGVNVINFSIGSSAGGGAFNEPTEKAFFGASNAGVFVAASAGNNGPTATTVSPVGHISPWLTTVANSTHNRIYVGSATLGNGAKVTGASGNANTPSAPLILAADAGLPGVNALDLSRCFGTADTGYAALLDPVKVAGKVLVCDRGNNVLVNKSANAKTAGAVGVIIANVPGGAATILNQAHSVSTIHITKEDGAIVKSYVVNNQGANAALGELRGVLDPTVKAPIVNGSSSRGPNVANANILKPDVSAPGTDILAAVTADLTEDQRNAVAAGGVAPSTDWAFYTGTSMASPHVAGVAALLKHRHPDWSPAAIKSALMTTATDTYSDGLNGSMKWDATAKTTGNLPWGQGAGHIKPTSAADPGLVYDVTELDYKRFLCGAPSASGAQVVSAAECLAIGSVPAYNLNLASLTAANVLGSLTLTRTVTNVGATSATYNATATLPGYNVVVTPSALTLGAGAKGTFTVKLTRTNAPIDTWVYGNLTWNDGTHNVRSPLVARGSALAAASLVYSEATSGSKVLTVGTGFAGAMSSVKSALVPATVDTRVIGKAGAGTDATCAAGGGAGVNVHSVTIPAGTMAARFALFDSDTTGNGNSDLDLVLLKDGAIVAKSGGDTSNEVVNLSNPAAGDYKVCVVGYAPVGGQATYSLSSWLLSPVTGTSNFKVSLPSTATIGGTASVLMSWNGLAAGKRFLGKVNYLLAGVTQGATMVEVDTTDPLPLFQNASTKQASAE